jgi:hypothetical protein
VDRVARLDHLRAAVRRSPARLFAPVDIAALVLFRVAFGSLMLWEVYRYFNYGWIGRYYVDPSFNFPYVGFEWVKPWPGSWIYYHFYGLGVLAFCIVIGLWYRISAALFFLGFTYVFLLEKAHYLNHFYLISLFSLLMILIPANRAWSLDVVTGAVSRAETAPAWTLWLLRAQMAIVYVFGGLAKVNGDWLRGEPIRAWLSRRTDFPLIGRWFTEEWMVYGFAYGGLLFDLLIVPFLLWRRTRLPAFVVAVTFHLANNELFQIGVFPWFAIAATLLFFPPETTRRIARWVAAAFGFSRRASSVSRSPRPPVSPSPRLSTRQCLIVTFVAVYVAIQVLVPLRHFVYPGNVSWTEQGHRFAWHMKLRAKSGEVRFFATDPATGETWEIDARSSLTSRQRSNMATHPDMILQFAHVLRDELTRAGYDGVEIRVLAMASRNGRPRQLLIDPTVDLARVDHSLLPAAWILPLETALDAAASPPILADHQAAIDALLLAADRPDGDDDGVEQIRASPERDLAGEGR